MYENQPAKKTTVTLNSVAASSTTTTPVIDLGNNWCACIAVALKRNSLASAGEVLSIEYSDDNTTYYTIPNYQFTGQASNSTSATIMDVGGRVAGRYVRAKFLNGSTIQSATATLQLVVQPDFN